MAYLQAPRAGPSIGLGFGWAPGADNNHAFIPFKDERRVRQLARLYVVESLCVEFGHWDSGGMVHVFLALSFNIASA